MAVNMRLTRVGGKKDPVWRVVVADSRSPRDGRFIETLGRYNAQTDPSTIVLNEERIRHWLDRGAQPSNTVKKLMRAENTGHAMPASEAPTPVATPPKPKAEPAAEAAPAEAPEAEAPADAEAAAEEVAAEQEASEQPAPDAEGEADVAAEADAPAEGDSSDDS